MQDKKNRFRIDRLEPRVAPRITAVETQTNGGGNEPKGEANGVPVVVTNENPSGHAPPGQN